MRATFGVLLGLAVVLVFWLERHALERGWRPIDGRLLEEMATHWLLVGIACVLVGALLVIERIRLYYATNETTHLYWVVLVGVPTAVSVAVLVAGILLGY